MIRGRGVAKNIIDFAIFSGLGGTGCLSEVAAVMEELDIRAGVDEMPEGERKRLPSLHAE